MTLNQFLFMSAMASLLSCQNTTGSENAKSDSTFKKESLAYPFTARSSINWLPGDEKNALIVLNCLKKYVDGDIKGAVAYFADTAEFIADKFDYKGSRDNLSRIITDMRSASETVSKVFDTWITCYYPAKDETWVTLWYTEIMTDKKGNTDSIRYTDDVLVRNDHILVYDEKQRLFPGSIAK